VKLTQQELKQVLSYNPISGEFTWLVKQGSVSSGATAGWPDDAGYVGIGINGKCIRAHRLAWLYMTGEFPPCFVDHKNNIKSDNRWCNLRPATRSQNMCNTVLRSNNSSGYKGVSLIKASGKWSSKIRVNGKHIWLGSFEDKESAAEAYIDAAKKYHHDYARFK
jgi:hypothetical protein